MVLSVHGALKAGFNTIFIWHWISRLFLIPLVSAHNKGDLKRWQQLLCWTVNVHVNSGYSTKLLQSHACPAADLLTWSHAPSYCSTSTLHLCSHPYAHTEANTAGDFTETHLCSLSHIHWLLMCVWHPCANPHNLWLWLTDNDASEEVVCVEEQNIYIQTDN